MSNFRDYIPEGEDNSAYKAGFTDFQGPTPAVEVKAGVPVIKESFADLKRVYKELTGKKVKVGTSKVELKKMIEELMPIPTSEVPAEPVVAEASTPAPEA